MWQLDLRRLGMSAITCAALAAPAARADPPPSCGWVDSIQHWNGSFGWIWSHHDQWVQLPATSLKAATQDGGSGSFSLDGFLGNFSGDIDGALHFDDYSETDDLAVTTFTHTVLSGAIIGPAPGTASQMLLQLDDTACTYTWSTVGPFAAGTTTTEVGSEDVVKQPNAILPGTHPIPALPGPLSFSGPAPVTINPVIGAPDPQFVTYADGATASLLRQNAPTPNPALVDWIFEPGDSTAPLNDACAGATFVLGNDSQDTSFATTDASDPAPSCGAGDRSVWFLFLAPNSGTAQISTSGSGYDTIVSVWPMTQICGALTSEVACGSNGASVPVQANTAYRVQVQRNGSSGTGALQISVSVPEPAVAWATLTALAALAQIRRVRPVQ